MKKGHMVQKTGRDNSGYKDPAPKEPKESSKTGSAGGYKGK